MSFSFKKQFMDEMEKGIRSRLQRTERLLKNSPSQYGLGTKGAHVPQLSEEKPQLPLMPKNEPFEIETARNQSLISRTMAPSLKSGYFSSLRSKFESLTKAATIQSFLAKESEGGPQRVIGPELLTRGEQLGKNLMKKAMDQKTATVNRALAKRRAKEALIKKMKSGA